MARRLSVVSAPSCARRRLIRSVSRRNPHSIMQNVKEDLSWMVGATCLSIVIESPNFTTFTFSHDVRLVAECPWRLVINEHIGTSSHDHGQLFGRTDRVDAQAEVMSVISTQPIVTVSCANGLLDLSIGFGSVGMLQVVPFSSGYEGWSLYGPRGLHLVAVGGGRLVVFPASS